MRNWRGTSFSMRSAPRKRVPTSRPRSEPPTAVTPSGRRMRRLVGGERRAFGRVGDDGAALGALGRGRRCDRGRRLGRVGRLVERGRRQIGLERHGARSDDVAANGAQLHRRVVGRGRLVVRGRFGIGRRERRERVDVRASADERARPGARRPLEHRRCGQLVREEALAVVVGGARARRPFADGDEPLVDGDHAAHDVDLAALRRAEALELLAAAGDAQDAGAGGADPDGVAEAGRERGDAGVGEEVLPLAGAQAAEPFGAAGPHGLAVGDEAGEKAADGGRRPIGPAAPHARATIPWRWRAACRLADRRRCRRRDRRAAPPSRSAAS